MIWWIGGYSILVTVMLMFSVYYNYKFGRALIRMEDALEVSLDKLDDRYESISKILEIPLFYDSPQIRQVVSDIKDCQDSILFIANEIGQLEEIPDGEEENS
jgi:hypothetical protein